MNDLIIAIINLIKYLISQSLSVEDSYQNSSRAASKKALADSTSFPSKSASKTGFKDPAKAQSMFKEISSALDANDREKHLFRCFAIPSDDVRLALVNCILQVPLQELDIEEINYLMKVVRESKNIGAGKAEEIISTIFLIFINLITDKVNAAANNFRIKYGKNAISHCLEILLKNQNRIIEEEDEAEEKLMLSVSCLYLLKEASKAPEMAKFMKEPSFSEVFVDNLLAEQNYSFPRHHGIPIEVEYTALGLSFSSLKECLAGAKALQPFTPVSFRVVQQIANILQNFDTNKFNKLKFTVGEKKVEAMRNHLQAGFKKRINVEMGLWREKDEEDFFTATKKAGSVEHCKMEHSSFAENNGLYLLILFLTNKSAKKPTPEEEELLKQKLWHEFGRKFKEFEEQYEKWMEYKSKDEEQRKLMRKEDKLPTKMLKTEKEKKKLTGRNIDKLRRAMQLQKLITVPYYDKIYLEDKSLYLGESTSSHKKQNMEIIVDMKTTIEHAT